MTLLASFVTAHHHARLGAERSLFELDAQVLAQIRAALHPAAAPPAGSEGIAKAEELAKNVAQILEGRSVETHASAGRVAHSSMPEAIVKRALLRIGKHGIGFGDFLEALFRIWIIRVAIGMVLHRELAICAFQFLIAYGAAHGQYFVIVAFCVRGQNKNLS